MLKDLLLEAVRAAGEVMRAHFLTDYKISSKDGVNDLVTEIDKLSEKTIVEMIKTHFPDHQILSEEMGAVTSNSEYKWIIDPIDGTVNFAHKVPLCCVSIGIERAGKMLLGAVYNPFMEELYFAEKGEGATLNGNPIHVSENTDFAKAFVVTGFPHAWNETEDDPMKPFEWCVKKGLPVRRTGSAAINLCWVASGRFDAFWQHQLNAWDAAAGVLIVEEAGGMVSDFNNDPYSLYQSQLLATNGSIHHALLNTITGK